MYESSSADRLPFKQANQQAYGETTNIVRNSERRKEIGVKDKNTFQLLESVKKKNTITI